MENEYGPVDEQFIEQMKMVAEGVDNLFNPQGEKKIGFILMVFPFDENEEKRCNYISNANRRDIITFLREQADKFERMEKELPKI